VSRLNWPEYVPPPLKLTLVALTFSVIARSPDPDSEAEKLKSPLLRLIVEAGVSRMTVSRVLNRRGGCRPELAKRIQQIAKHLGYRSNPHVSAAMEQVRRARPAQYLETLAWLHEFGPAGSSASTHGRRLMEGTERRASELGYRIEHHSYPRDKADGRRLRRILQARGIRGILLGSIGSRKFLTHFDLTGFACAAQGISIQKPRVSQIVGEAAERTRMALEQCTRRGCIRPLLAIDRSSYESTRHHFLEPLLMWYHERNQAIKVPLYLFDGGTGPGEDLRSLVKNHHVDVILSPRRRVYDFLCKTVTHPAFVHLNWNREGSRGLAGVDQRSDVQGSAAVDLVSARLHRGDFHPDPEPREVLIPPAWKNGPSLT